MTVDWLEQTRPRLRASVRIGPPLLKGATSVHYVADPETTAYLQVGPREAFLMARLDGTRTPHEIGLDYAAEFGKRLGPENWQQLFTLLGSRGLLEPADPSLVATLRERAETTRHAEGRTALLWRLPIPGALALVSPVTRALGWLLNPVLAMVLGLAGLSVCVLVALNWVSLYDSLGRVPWWLTALGLVISWLMIGLHEFGHAIACHRYGGKATQIGFMWRFPLIAPYCKVDDVVTFGPARHRVMTSFAGIYVNLVAILPFGALWLWGPPWAHDLATTLLLFGTVTVLVNLLPVLQLDGYHMLEHATSTIGLQSESFTFAVLAVQGKAAGYPTRAKWLYSLYVLVTLAILLPVAWLLGSIWFDTLEGLWGPVAATLVLVAEAVVVAAFLTWAVRRRRVVRG
ncbi:hypothetical protein [Herbidospora sp. RD11066]